MSLKLNSDSSSRPSLKRPTVTFTNEEVFITSNPTKPVAIAVNSALDEDVTHAPLKQENPQEAYSPPHSLGTLPSPTTGQDSPQTTTPATQRRSVDGWKRRRRGRQVRLASVSDECTSDKEVKKYMPATQYETTFRRRAVCKEERVSNPSSSPSRGIFGSNSRMTRKEAAKAMESISGYDEEVGDVSLGMKLNILGGRVIVQTINPLADGRASPAQLTGMVKRGDVLIAIDGKSIINLPLEQLVVALQPLSTPQDDGSYKRILKLRFSAGEGLEALERNEDYLSKAGQEPGVFSLTQFLPQDFPMVDQLSGQPMFDDTNIPPPVEKTSKPVVATASRPSADTYVVDRIGKKSLSVNELISLGIADLLQVEKTHFLSEFFAWNESYSELLRPSLVVTIRAGEEIAVFLKKKKELIDQGVEAVKGAQALTLSMEDIDKGKDLRSFQAWSSNASLRSRASTRRRYVMEAASVIASTIVEEADSDLAVSVGTEELDDLDGIDGDELLLQLAAHDELWRRQVLETISNATKEMHDADKDDDVVVKDVPRERDISETLGNLFLGEQVNKLLLKKKKSFALPQDEVTCVLFDLVTHLASTTPDEISVKGKFDLNPQTSLLPFQRSKGSAVDRDSVLATLFVVNEVFPAWLKCFKPLPWEERRVLWPHTKASTVGSTVAGSVADDLLTIDSPGASPVPSRKKKNLRETIEDMELDVESRAETCFLITFYFTQEILPGMSNISGTWRSTNSWTERDALEFVDTYGTYLKLPMALAYASFLKSENVVNKLLELANHDPRHLEALKDISKVNSLILYEPTMLSAIIRQIRTMRQQKVEQRSRLIHLAVSAFPDVRPWLVRKGCLEDGSDDSSHAANLSELYYSYLSLLLHPTDGHEAARHDADLVNEWCDLSLQGDYRDAAHSEGRRMNFRIVASREQSEYKMYSRDLPFLMNLAIVASEVELTLELINEMLDYKRLVTDKSLMIRIVSTLREIAAESLPVSSGVSEKPMKSAILKRLFSVFEKVRSSEERCGITELTSVSREYETIISLSDSKDRPDLLALLAANATPVYTLQALYALSHDRKMAGHDFLPILRLSLERSATLRNREELSPSLLRLEKARISSGETKASVSSNEDSNPRQRMLWRLMASGKNNIQIAK